MPLPLLVVAALQTALGALAYEVSKEAAARYLRPKLIALKDEYLAMAVESMGLELSPDGHLTDEGITALINNKLLAGSGVQIDSLLDRDRLRKGLERLAIERLCVEVGLPAGTAQTIGGVRGALQAWAGDQVMSQLASEAGAVFDAAKPSAFVQKVVVQSVKKVGWNVATDMTDKGIKNRARQAKYRRSHKKQWVEK